jgi:integrase
MARKRTQTRGRSRIYWRKRGGEARAYADLRSLGGGREPLIAPGDTRATTDPTVAQVLLARRIEQLEEQRRAWAVLGVRRRATLREYADEHHAKKVRSGNTSEQWLRVTKQELDAAVEFFGAGRDLAGIGVEDVQAYAHWLAQRTSRRGGTLSRGSQRHYLNCLSNLFRRAQGEGLIRGVNPVQALMEKPVAPRREARWLEVSEAARLLEAARTYPYDAPAGSTAGQRLQAAIGEVLGEGECGEMAFMERMRAAGSHVTLERLRAYAAGSRVPHKGFLFAAAAVLGVEPARLWRGRAAPATARTRPPAHMHPLLATFLLTGGRESEVLGLTLGDVSFARGTVTFRPNEWRRLKTATSHRVVPLWPQLREVLAPHVTERRRAGASDDDLLFCSARTGGMVRDARKGLDAIAVHAGWQAGEIRSRAFRHTYCAARLQTLDRGAPVALWTVARELGHGGDAMVRRVYGHLGAVRHRAEVVEYRVVQHRRRNGKRAQAL